MTLWNKIKLGVLVVTILYMIFQALVTQQLNGKIKDLESTQQKLHDQIAQVEKNYNYLSSVYQGTMEANKSYVNSSTETKKQSTDLEKAFNKIEQVKPTIPTTSKVSSDVKQTEEPSALRTSNPTPIEWRKLLDDTYCRAAAPGTADCDTGLPTN